MTQSPLLQMRGITKRFGGHPALDGVDFTVRSGEIHALMGENGAGKSTLIKVLNGAYALDQGSILLEGKQVRPRSPALAQRIGISTVFQEVNLIPTLSVAENIYLGRQPRRWGRIHWKSIYRGAEAALARLNFSIDVKRQLSNYSIAIQQMVAITRALDFQAKLLVLDEPTSSLDKGEVARLFEVMRRLRSDGLGIVFVTHFLDQVYEVSDRITVLRNGKLVGEYEAAKLPRMELVSRMMGKELAQFELTGKQERSAASEDLLAARGMGRKGMLNPLTLKVGRGELVGLAGLLGSGRTETAKLLFGIDRVTDGVVEWNGAPVRFGSPRAAIAAGLAMLPEDRKVQGIIPDLSIRENIALALQGRRGWMRTLSKAKQLELAEKFIAALGIVCRSPEQPIKELSGGNQQKVILARWLASNPKLLILDEPTRGIDVGAKAEIQKLMLAMKHQGMGILFISSELEEVVRCSDRVVVLRDREQVGELARGQISEPAIMRAIAGERA